MYEDWIVLVYVEGCMYYAYTLCHCATCIVLVISHVLHLEYIYVYYLYIYIYACILFVYIYMYVWYIKIYEHAWWWFAIAVCLLVCTRAEPPICLAVWNAYEFLNAVQMKHPVRCGRTHIICFSHVNAGTYVCDFMWFDIFWHRLWLFCTLWKMWPTCNIHTRLFQ